jgi:hypothetical protein
MVSLDRETWAVGAIAVVGEGMMVDVGSGMGKLVGRGIGGDGEGISGRSVAGTPGLHEARSANAKAERSVMGFLAKCDEATMGGVLHVGLM